MFFKLFASIIILKYFICFIINKTLNSKKPFKTFNFTFKGFTTTNTCANFVKLLNHRNFVFICPWLWTFFHFHWKSIIIPILLLKTFTHWKLLHLILKIRIHVLLSKSIIHFVLGRCISNPLGTILFYTIKLFISHYIIVFFWAVPRFISIFIIFSCLVDNIKIWIVT